MKRICLLLFFLLLCDTLHAQSKAPFPKPTIVANLIRLVEIEDIGKVSGFLSVKQCRYLGKTRINDKFYYLYKAPKRFSSYGVEKPDSVEEPIGSAFYTTLSIDEYTGVLDQLKKEGYQLYQNDGSNPNFLTYAKAENLITLSISSAKKPAYTIAVSKLAIY